MTLEHYDSLYRDYPKLISDEATRAIENARVAFANAAQLESARAQQLLSEKVAETSVIIAQKLAERPFRIHRVTAMIAALVIFGAVCMTAGYALATRPMPSWARAANAPQPAVLSAILAAPAGWMAFVLLLPAAAHAGITGWNKARDPQASRAEQLWGWALVVSAITGSAACATIVLGVT